MSKQVVMAEEMQNQLGDRLPGAIGLATEALRRMTGDADITRRQFREMMKEGLVPTAEFLPHFKDVLLETFGPAAAQAANSLQGSIARLNTAFFEFKVQVGQGGVADAIQEFATSLFAAAEGSESVAQQLGADLGDVIRGVGEAALFAATHLQGIVSVIAGLIAFKAAFWFLELAKGMWAAAAAMTALNVAMRANIFGAIATAIGLAATALLYFRDTTVAVADSADELNEKLEENTKLLKRFKDAEGQTGRGAVAALPGSGVMVPALEQKRVGLMNQLRHEAEDASVAAAKLAGYIGDVNDALGDTPLLTQSILTKGLEEQERKFGQLILQNKAYKEEKQAVKDAEEEAARAAKQATNEAARLARTRKDAASDLEIEVEHTKILIKAQKKSASFYNATEAALEGESEARRLELDLQSDEARALIEGHVILAQYNEELAAGAEVINASN